VRRALGGSCEELFHESGVPRFLLDLDGARGELRELAGPRLQRAIAVIHVDRTRARSRSSPATGARCAAT
jgi:hypothetical protein